MSVCSLEKEHCKKFICCPVSLALVVSGGLQHQLTNWHTAARIICHPLSIVREVHCRFRRHLCLSLQQGTAITSTHHSAFMGLFMALKRVKWAVSRWGGREGKGKNRVDTNYKTFMRENGGNNGLQTCAKVENKFTTFGRLLANDALHCNEKTARKKVCDWKWTEERKKEGAMKGTIQHRATSLTE